MKIINFLINLLLQYMYYNLQEYGISVCKEDYCWNGTYKYSEVTFFGDCILSWVLSIEEGFI